MTLADEILFKWAPNKSKVLREFWEDYALVMETLEENQVRNPTWAFCFSVQRYYDKASLSFFLFFTLQIHVVRPVLNRIDTLIQTTVNDSQGKHLN